MVKPLIYVIVGSTRDVRKGIVPAEWIFRAAQARPEFEVELVDLKKWSLPFLNEPKSPGAGDYQLESTQRWGTKIAAADGFIIVTPEYNHAPNAALKNALDTVYKEWNRKPVAFVSYGGPAGGVRAVEQLRQIAVELQLAPIQAAVMIPLISQAFDDQGNPTNERLAGGADRLLTELAWWTNALKQARDSATPTA